MFIVSLFVGVQCDYGWMYIQSNCKDATDPFEACYINLRCEECRGEYIYYPLRIYNSSDGIWFRSVWIWDDGWMDIRVVLLGLDYLAYMRCAMGAMVDNTPLLFCEDSLPLLPWCESFRVCQTMTHTFSTSKRFSTTGVFSHSKASITPKQTIIDESTCSPIIYILSILGSVLVFEILFIVTGLRLYWK
jgi:hypothetical protein